jgi:sn-1 stearoyl-lipid 9-desaturase
LKGLIGDFHLETLTLQKPKFRKHVLVYMLIVHAIACLAPLYFTWTNLAWFIGLDLLTGCLGITLCFHRLLTHKSFEANPWLTRFLVFCGSLAMQGSVGEWVGDHRRHHEYSDQEGDPHNSRQGFFWSHFGWLLYTTHDVSSSTKKYVDKMLQDPYIKWMDKNYFGIFLASIAALFLIGGPGLVVWGGALRMVFVYHKTWLVNSAAHLSGYQSSLTTGDDSRNNWWVALLTYGEGWHNNHHDDQSRAKHGLSWWELDLTFWIIQLLEAVGLVKNVRV